MIRALPGGGGTLPPAWSDPVNDGEQQWTAYFRPLQIRWRLFFAVFVVIVTGVVVATLLTPKTYTTTAKLLIGTSTDPAHTATDPNTVLPMLNALLAMSGQQSAETYAELIQEPPVAQRVISDLGLRITPKALLADVAVKPVTNTAIMGVSATARTPELSAAIANDFVGVFVKREKLLVGSQADEALGGLQTELPLAEKRMKSAQQLVVAQESKLHIPNADLQKQTLLAQAASIDTKTRGRAAREGAIRSEASRCQPTDRGFAR